MSTGRNTTQPIGRQRHAPIMPPLSVDPGLSGSGTPKPNACTAVRTLHCSGHPVSTSGTVIVAARSLGSYFDLKK
jgi:hypothetical protein